MLLCVTYTMLAIFLGLHGSWPNFICNVLIILFIGTQHYFTSFSSHINVKGHASELIVCMQLICGHDCVVGIQQAQV